jgi:hypothetical protein
MPQNAQADLPENAKNETKPRSSGRGLYVWSENDQYSDFGTAISSVVSVRLSGNGHHHLSALDGLKGQVHLVQQLVVLVNALRYEKLNFHKVQAILLTRRNRLNGIHLALLDQSGGLGLDGLTQGGTGEGHGLSRFLGPAIFVRTPILRGTRRDWS